MTIPAAAATEEGAAAAALVGGLVVVLSSRDHSGQKEIEEEAQANHSILNARRKYHYQNKALYIDSNMTNCIRPVRTFFSGL